MAAINRIFNLDNFFFLTTVGSGLYLATKYVSPLVASTLQQISTSEPVQLISKIAYYVYMGFVTL